MEQIDIMASADDLRYTFHGGYMESVSAPGEGSQASDHARKWLTNEVCKQFAEFLIAKGKSCGKEL